MKQLNHQYVHWIPEAPLSKYPEGYKHILIYNEQRFRKMMDIFEAAPIMSLDTETTGLSRDRDHIVGINICCEKDRGFYLPFKHKVDPEYNLPFEYFFEVINLALRKKVFFFNYKFDAFFIEKEGISIKNMDFIDISVPIWLTDTNLRYPSLKWAERHFLGWVRSDYESTIKQFGDISYVSPTDINVIQYCAADAISTYVLGLITTEMIKKECPFILKLDNECVKALYELEQTEVPLNKEYLQDLYDKVIAELQKLESEIYDHFGYKFRLDSDKELGEALESKGLHTGVVTPKSQRMSVKNEYIKKIDSPIAIVIAKYKTLKDLLGSFITPFKNEADRRGYARFSYKTTGPPTGRLSAGGEKGDPYYSPLNIQAVDKVDFVRRYAYPSIDVNNILGWKFSENKDDGYEVEVPNPELNIRRALIAPEGYYYVKLDYAGQELRVAANLSNEPLWINTFLKGEDLHTNQAIEIWGKDSYSQEKRKKVKPLNFGAIFGGSKWTFAKKLEIPEDEAEELLNKWWKVVPVLANWIELCKKRGRRQGVIYTPFGRPRRVKSYFSSPDRKVRAFAYRTVINTQIQGGGADLIKMALVTVKKKVLDINLNLIKFRQTVHDELDVVVRKDSFYLIEQIIEIMRVKRKDWKVPMDVGLEVGTSWGDMVEFHKVEDRWEPKRK